MSIGFSGQLLAYLVNPSHCDDLLAAADANGFCARSFARRYGLNGYDISAATVGNAQSVRVQVPVLMTERLVGSRDRRGDLVERWAVDYRVSRASDLGWIDVAAAATAQVTFAALGLTGAAPGGPAVSEPAATKHRLALTLPTTDATSQAVTYPLDIYVFSADALDPTSDLRRIGQIRRVLEGDPGHVISLDDPSQRRLSLYVQAYDPNVDQSPLTTAAIAALYESADVLVVFSSAEGGPP